MLNQLKILLLLVAFPLNAQEITNNLRGYYTTIKSDDLYRSLYFYADGHVLINDAHHGQFFQKDNKLYILPDKSVFIFSIEKNKIKGLSSWVKNSTFKKISIPKDIESDRYFLKYQVNAKHLNEFYEANYIAGLDEVNFGIFSNPNSYKGKMKNLCDQNLTNACAALFGLEYLEAFGGMNVLIEQKTVNKIKPNVKFEQLANKMINLGDNRGYGLLASYYIAIDDLIKAKNVVSKGMELGDENSLILFMELELDKSEEK